MPIFALLTRLLLCLSLLLNGAGSAVAIPGVHGTADAAPGADHAMAHAHAGKHMQAVQVARATMPCHEGMPPQADEHGDDCHDKAGKHGCCGTAAGCQCPHAQPLPALIALPSALPVPAQGGFPGSHQDGRGAPGLPRLERPPSA
ncbi:CopL family metal-binding regulatory protein [Xanthomonas sp. 1678]|uniref:CopL family metal-binding regulatory protein n=1 Tax=Xanthomonas sp. 1678 TaxID=3158788 RepID=UPI002856EA0C|nr:hypothetical protein [Xanthomonas translucens]